MSNTNPYQAPDGVISNSEIGEVAIEQVARGQKLIIYAILINIISIILQIVIHPIIGFVGLISLALSIIGIIKLATGLGSSVLAKIIYIILMIIPLVNLITLLVLNSRATRELRAAGYKVGLMGASK